tara:strand:- start:114 stop:353 length:240 start_codon:yes stop_codon:yes gene_type:complete
MTILKANETEKFWEIMLKDIKPELTIGTIDIYKINKNYVLFYGTNPIIETVEDAYGVHGATQPTLQDAVDVAILHEFSL